MVDAQPYTPPNGDVVNLELREWNPTTLFDIVLGDFQETSIVEIMKGVSAAGGISAIKYG